MRRSSLCHRIVAIALGIAVGGMAPGLASGQQLGEGGLRSISVVAETDHPGPRFGFSSLLNQVATSVTKVATSISGVTPPSSETIAVTPGQTVTFTLSGTVQEGGPNFVLDVFDSSLTFVSSTGGCVVAATPSPLPPLQPASVGGYLTCSPVLANGSGAFSFQVVFSVNANAPSHIEPNFNVACVENSTTQNNYNLCDPVAGTVAGLIPPVPPFPLLPLPPIDFVAPPPPPLLPPPPMAPMAPPSAGLSQPMMMPSMMPGVPVIPEADSLVLLGGGLAALGGFVALRRLVRRGEDPRE
jgi:hypothetical protein